MYSSKELNDLMLKVNRVCFSQDFRFAVVAKFKYIPSGLTYHIFYDKNGNLNYVILCKIYGFNNSVNNGISEYTDASDYDIGETDIPEEMKDFTEEYLKNNHKDLYDMFH